MRKFTFRYKTETKQNYTCVTIKELEELLGKETPNSKIPKIIDLILQWKRLLLGIILIWILIYTLVYLAGLKKEIAVLRRESAGLRQDILNLQEENAGLQRKLDAKQSSEISVSKEAGDSAPLETLLNGESEDEENSLTEDTNTPRRGWSGPN
ncbi:MAG: hypothetical protein GX425_01400, partial [Peptococcaceae bacterium]|nr:hypothetical protein [Peptococcaceae bacterium]